MREKKKKIVNHAEAEGLSQRKLVSTILVFTKLAGKKRVSEKEYFDALSAAYGFLCNMKLRHAEGSELIRESQWNLLCKSGAFEEKAEEAEKFWTKKLGNPSGGLEIVADVHPAVEPDAKNGFRLVASPKKS